jgi:hypothetical protein
LFRNISDACLTTRCNTPVGQQKDFVKAINLNVEASCKNLWSLHELNLGEFRQQLPVALQLLQNQLQTEASSGAISSSDQSTMSSALNDINSSLQHSGPSSSAGGTNASPGDLQSKIDTLIAGEVSSGKLTSDQAGSSSTASSGSSSFSALLINYRT